MLCFNVKKFVEIFCLKKLKCVLLTINFPINWIHSQSFSFLIIKKKAEHNTNWNPFPIQCGRGNIQSDLGSIRALVRTGPGPHNGPRRGPLLHSAQHVPGPAVEGHPGLLPRRLARAQSDPQLHQPPGSQQRTLPIPSGDQTTSDRNDPAGGRQRPETAAGCCRFQDGRFDQLSARRSLGLRSRRPRSARGWGQEDVAEAARIDAESLRRPQRLPGQRHRL